MEWKVGDKARVKGLADESVPVTITAVGEKVAIFKAFKDGIELSVPLHWLLPYHEPKKTVKMAPALIQLQNGQWVLTISCFWTRTDAEIQNGPSRRVIWPAKPDADGFYTVDEQPT